MSEEKQVLIKFVTKLPPNLRVPETPVAVPAQLKRYGLSQIINHLLALDPNRPFDFLIYGELLRKTLEQHLLDHQLSAEALLEVEYFPAVVPPKHKQSAPHDDWVSAVDGSWEGTIVSGSYDGNIRLWNDGLQCQLVFHAHASGTNAVACLPSSQGHLLLSAGKDHAVKLWQLPDGESGSQQLVATFSGHTDAVESVAVSPDGTRCCSSGWDGNLFMWRAGREVVDAAAEASAVPSSSKAAQSKKRKAAEADETEGAATEQPLSKLEGHLHCISSVSYPTGESVYSGGWDHSVRRWDVETGINTDTYNGSKAVCSVSCSQQAPNVVVFGSSDRAVRVWDSRGGKGEALSVKSYASHSGWVPSVQISPSSEQLVVSGSYDASVKLWDLRTAVPLATLTGQHTDKVLAVAWHGSKSLLSGGADCLLQLYSMDQEAAA